MLASRSSLLLAALALAGLVLDETVHFGVSELLVPFASTYEPGAVAWGVVALYLLVVPPFALAQRRMETRDGGGWRRPPPRRDTLDEARSQG